MFGLFFIWEDFERVYGSYWVLLWVLLGFRVLVWLFLFGRILRGFRIPIECSDGLWKAFGIGEFTRGVSWSCQWQQSITRSNCVSSSNQIILWSCQWQQPSNSITYIQSFKFTLKTVYKLITHHWYWYNTDKHRAELIQVQEKHIPVEDNKFSFSRLSSRGGWIELQKLFVDRDQIYKTGKRFFTQTIKRWFP